MANNPTPSYFVVMIDYGRRGLEAIVDPELTMRSVVGRIASGEYTNIAFVQYVDSQAGTVRDVTSDMFAAAGMQEAA